MGVESNVYYCLFAIFCKGMGLREYPQSIKYSNTIEVIIRLQKELCTAQDTLGEHSMHAYHHHKNCVSTHAITY